MPKRQGRPLEQRELRREDAIEHLVHRLWHPVGEIGGDVALDRQQALPQLLDQDERQDQGKQQRVHVRRLADLEAGLLQPRADLGTGVTAPVVRDPVVVGI